MPVSKTQRNAEAAANRRLTRAAHANPNTRCCTCNQTLDTCGPHGNGTHRNGTPARWDAGHPDGRWEGNERRPECSPCNRSRGAAAGNRQRGTGYDWPN